MLLPSRYRKFAYANVEELYTPIASGSQQLVLVLFRPSDIEQAILRLEELLAGDAVGGQVKDIETAISHEAKVGACTDCETAVEERGVFHTVGVEACRPELEHRKKGIVVVVTWQFNMS
jgi:hypothetical protein